MNRSTLVYVASLLEIALAVDILREAWTDKDYVALTVPIALALAGGGAAVAGRRGAIASVAALSGLMLVWLYAHTQDLAARDLLGIALFALTALVLAGLALTRRRLESELEARESEARVAWAREAEMVRMKDDFLSLVAHELRNPVSVIVGCADLLVRRVVPEGERTQVIQDLSTESQRLHALIEDLLAIARIDAGGRPALEPVLVPYAIATVLDEFGQRHKNEVRVDIAPDLPFAAGSELHIERALANILGNAAKYSPPASPIDVRARVVEGRVQIEVLDSGPGIPPGAGDLIFQRFYRAGNPETGGGYGLGLAISKRLLEANEGRIWARNREEGGLEVAFSLPPFQE